MFVQKTVLRGSIRMARGCVLLGDCRMFCRGWIGLLTSIPRRAASTVAILGVGIVLACGAEIGFGQNAESGGEYFEKHVRPLLIEKCSECHSAKTEKNGGLSVDSKESILRGGDSGPAVDLADTNSSLFLRAVEYRDPKLQMPPDGKLEADQVQLLRDWIRMGMVVSDSFEKSPEGDPSEMADGSSAGPLSVARAREHWAYRPLMQLERPLDIRPLDIRPLGIEPLGIASQGIANQVDGPITGNTERLGTENLIDAWLDERYRQASIEPSPLVDDETWLRRLSIDLHGLNPSYEDLESAKTRLQFSGNGGATHELAVAGERELLVEEYLASPRYAERFARHWMDVVRYAESLTLRGFVLGDVWRYRNYLIRSFQQDKPFDVFVMEQVAGDLLHAQENKDTSISLSGPELLRAQDRLVATTFLAIGDHNYEEQDKKQLEMDAIDEQLDVLGKAFLGQTLSCARCHDHKFDPIPTSDYYALAGILKSSVAMDHENVSKWVRIPLPVSSEEQQAFAMNTERLTSLQKQIASLKGALSSKGSKSTVLAVEQLPGIVVDNAKAKKIGEWDDSSSVANYVGSGYLHDRNQKRGEKSVTFECSEIPTGKYIVRVAYAPGENRSSRTQVRIFSADGDQAFSIDQKKSPSDDGLWQTLGTFNFEKGGQAFVIISNEGADGHVIADAVQFLPEGQATRGQATGGQAASGQAASGQTSRSTQEPQTIADGQQEIDREAKAKEQLGVLEKELSQLQKLQESVPMAQSLRPSPTPSGIAIHVRGSVHRLGASVPRGFLSCINEHEPELARRITIDPAANGRLELAQWLVAPENPLTARVYVNRVWANLMGHGIVRTVDNFGTTGLPPSDPQLLDDLAGEFIRQGWSTKWLVRTIVTSKAYRRALKPTESAKEIDPENGYFSYGHLRRLDAESLRDSMLRSSGELQESELKGGSMFPAVGSTVRAGTKEDYRYEHEAGYRSVYLPWFRNSLPELVREFDGANPSFSISERSRSTVSTQALALMNSPWVSKRAEAASAGIEPCEGEADCNRVIETLFLKILGRVPTEVELRWGRAVLSEASAKELAHQLFASIDFRYAP